MQNFQPRRVFVDPRLAPPRMMMPRLAPKTSQPPLPPASHMAWSWFGSFVGVGVLSAVDYFLVLEETDLIFITGSFGAQAVLLFAAIATPLAQPWNAVFGSGLSGLIGVACYKALGSIPVLASASAVSCAIVAMLLTRSLHPPAGATALIAVLGSERIHHMGWLYVLFPCVLGSVVNVALAVLMSRAEGSEVRKYPTEGYCPYELAPGPGRRARADDGATVALPEKAGR